MRLPPSVRHGQGSEAEAVAHMSVPPSNVLVMGRLILTGLTKSSKHNFVLRYEFIEGKEHCWVDCICGFSQELIAFNNYGGVKEVERVWNSHTSAD